MRRVAIVGAGALPFSSRYETTFRALALEAAKKAFEDCGLGPKDVDTVVWSIYCETMLRQQIPNMILHDYLGMQGKGGLRVEAGAATDGYALNAAFAQIASGLCDVVLLSAVQKGGDFYSSLISYTASKKK